MFDLATAFGCVFAFICLTVLLVVMIKVCILDAIEGKQIRTPASYIRARKLAKKARLIREALEASRVFYKGKHDIRVEARNRWDRDYYALRDEVFPQEAVDEWVTVQNRIWGLPRSPSTKRKVTARDFSTKAYVSSQQQAIYGLQEYTRSLRDRIEAS